MTKSEFRKGYEELRRCLIEARTKRGMFQTELAARLGRPQSFVSNFENGLRRIDVVEFLLICEVLGADPKRILKAVLSVLPRK